MESSLDCLFPCPLNLENHCCSDLIYLSGVSGILALCDGVVESMSLEIRQSWNLGCTYLSVCELFFFAVPCNLWDLVS